MKSCIPKVFRKNLEIKKLSLLSLIRRQGTKSKNGIRCNLMKYSCPFLKQK